MRRPAAPNARAATAGRQAACQDAFDTESYRLRANGLGRRREKHMERPNLVLAALAAGGENASYWPVQVQKLLFLIDREASALVGGPHFPNLTPSWPHRHAKRIAAFS